MRYASANTNEQATNMSNRIPVSDFHAYPDAHGRFADYGGIFMPETLMPPLEELAAAYLAMREDPAFIAEFERDL